MYASEKTGTVTIGTVVVSIQSLNWKVLKRAAAIAHEDQAARLARVTSSPALVAALADRAARLAAQAAEASPKPAAVGAPPVIDGTDAAPSEATPEPTADPEPRALAPLTEAQLTSAREARYLQYDQETVLRGGITSSSDKKKPEALINDLEEEAADRLHREILDLTLPPIDANAPETVRKNV